MPRNLALLLKEIEFFYRKLPQTEDGCFVSHSGDGRLYLDAILPLRQTPRGQASPEDQFKYRPKFAKNRLNVRWAKLDVQLLPLVSVFDQSCF